MDVDNCPGGNTEDIIFDEKKVFQLFDVFSIKIYLFIFHTLIVTLCEFQVEELKELSKQPDIYERLTRSLAPNIWELEDVKKGLLCQVLQLLHSFVA